VAFPWYFEQRRHYGRARLTLAGLFVSLFFLGSTFVVSNAIQTRRKELAFSQRQANLATVEVNAASVSSAAVAAPFLAKIDANWTDFAGLPSAAQTSDRFGALLAEHKILLDQVPELARPLVKDYARQQTRRHFSAWSSTETGISSAGVGATDLVPSTDVALCQKRAALWFTIVGYVTIFRTFGFERIVCPTKTWNIKDEAEVCYLWRADSSNPGVRSAATVWADLEHYQAALELAQRTADPSDSALAALGSNGGAFTVVAGTKAGISDIGHGWFAVTGERFSGYVHSELCHHTASN
jgi:hypothetical protein